MTRGGGWSEDEDDQQDDEDECSDTDVHVPPFLLRSQCPPRVPSQTCSALLGQLRARYGESHRHLRLAVLHAVTNSDGSLNAIVRSVGRPKGDISRVLWDFVDGGVLEVEPVEDEEGTEPAFLLTPKGDVLMDVWHYEEDDEAERDAR